MKKDFNQIPSISFIVPLHNEEDFLVVQVNKLTKIIKKLNLKNYEIILIENGSVDDTYRLAKKLSLTNNNIELIKSSIPHYGLAIKKGLLTSVYDPIIQLDLDLIEEKFIKTAIKSYGRYDILVGSKYLGTGDNRSLMRKLLSYGLRKTINILFNYHGTDTHGIKAYRRSTVIDLISKLPMTKHMYDSSIVIEAVNKGLTITETPINVKELRPSRFPSTKRIFEAIFDIFVLFRFKLNNLYRIKLKFPIPFI